MQIPVLIEPVAGNGYRAAALGYTGEGVTREEALRNVQKLVSDRVAAGAEIVPLGLPTLPPAGDLRDDPMLEEWKQAMAQYRRKREKQLDKVLRPKAKRRRK